MSKRNTGHSLSPEPDADDLDILLIVRAINNAGEMATEGEICRGLKWMRRVRAEAACLSLVENGLVSARFPAKDDAVFAKPVPHPTQDGKPTRKGTKQ